jgi:hypothetical protein
MVGSIRIGVAKDLPGVYQTRQPLFRELDLVSQRDGLTFDCQYRHRAAYGRGKKQRTVALDREPLWMVVDLDLSDDARRRRLQVHDLQEGVQDDLLFLVVIAIGRRNHRQFSVRRNGDRLRRAGDRTAHLYRGHYAGRIG